MKHTPGPWSVDYEVSEDGPMIVNRTGVCFVQVYSVKGKAKHDAHLIAAAPEMLEALEDVKRYCEDHGRDYPASVWKAIAKARGEV